MVHLFLDEIVFFQSAVSSFSDQLFLFLFSLSLIPHRFFNKAFYYDFMFNFHHGY